MPKIIDQTYLRDEQYRDSSNLKKRVGLHERFSTNQTGWFRWVAEKIALPVAARVLEIGCGPGLLWETQGERFSAAAQVTLTDFSSGMLGQARFALRGQDRTYQYAVNDAQALPFADNSIDLLIANHMLYHVPDRPRALAEFQRVLKTGGILAAATNGKGHLRELHAWIARAADGPLEQLDGMIWGQTLGFNLENGAEQLSPFFQEVRLLHYPDSLEVTEVEPLLDYSDSMTLHAANPRYRTVRERLRELWSVEIQVRKAVHISKETGLFLARK